MAYRILLSVAVVPRVDEHSILPGRYRLMPAVSATYHVTSSEKLPIPVKILIEHCSEIKDNAKDTPELMVAHKGPPYYFKSLPVARVYEHDHTYAELELDKFCFLRFLKNTTSDDHLSRLTLHTLYHDDNTTATLIVTKNLRVHKIAVKKEIKHDRYEERPLVCDCRNDPIVFSVLTTFKSWEVLFDAKPPTINAIDINRYEPGETPPLTKLNMIWKGQGRSREEKVPINISANNPSIMTFHLTCRLKLESLSEQRLMDDKIQQPRPIIAPSYCYEQPLIHDKPDLPKLLKFDTSSGDPINIIKGVATKYEEFGTLLLKDSDGTELNY